VSCGYKGLDLCQLDTFLGSGEVNPLFWGWRFWNGWSRAADIFESQILDRQSSRWRRLGAFRRKLDGPVSKHPSPWYIPEFIDTNAVAVWYIPNGIDFLLW